MSNTQWHCVWLNQKQYTHSHACKGPATPNEQKLFLRSSFLILDPNVQNQSILFSNLQYEREVGSRYKLVWLRCYTATSLRLKTECENDDLYIMTAGHLLCKFATKNYHFNIEIRSSHQNRHTPATLLHCYALKRRPHTKIDIPQLHCYIATA